MRHIGFHNMCMQKQKRYFDAEKYCVHTNEIHRIHSLVGNNIVHDVFVESMTLWMHPVYNICVEHNSRISVFWI